jgi:hypothetical protein
MSAPGPKAAFVRVPCHVAEVPNADIGMWLPVSPFGHSPVLSFVHSGTPLLCNENFGSFPSPREVDHEADGGPMSSVGLN